MNLIGGSISNPSFESSAPIYIHSSELVITGSRSNKVHYQIASEFAMAAINFTNGLRLLIAGKRFNKRAGWISDNHPIRLLSARIEEGYNHGDFNDPVSVSEYLSNEKWTLDRGLAEFCLIAHHPKLLQKVGTLYHTLGFNSPQLIPFSIKEIELDIKHPHFSYVTEIGTRFVPKMIGQGGEMYENPENTSIIGILAGINNVSVLEQTITTPLTWPLRWRNTLRPSSYNLNKINAPMLGVMKIDC